MTRIWTIAKRELMSYFNSAIAYTALESGPTKTLAVQASSLHS